MLRLSESASPSPDGRVSRIPAMSSAGGAVVAWWRTATFKPRSLVLKQQYTANIAVLQLAGSQNCVRDTLTHTGTDEMIYFYVKNQSQAKSDFDLTIAILRVV